MSSTFIDAQHHTSTHNSCTPTLVATNRLHQEIYMLPTFLAKSLEQLPPHIQSFYLTFIIWYKITIKLQESKSSIIQESQQHYNKIHHIVLYRRAIQNSSHNILHLLVSIPSIFCRQIQHLIMVRNMQTY